MAAVAESTDRAAALTVIAVATAAGIVAWLLLLSTGWWGVSHDTANHFYVAWLMSRGAVIYRDVFEVNWPGTFLTFRALLALGLDGDLGWRLVDLALVLAAAGLAASLLLPAGRLAAAIGAVMVAWSHLMVGSTNLGQRDHFIGVLVLAAVWAMRRGIGGAVAAGVALGVAATIKPFAMVLPVAALVLVDGSWLRRIRIALIVGAVMAVPLGATTLYLVAHDALGEFLRQQLYAMRIYANTGRQTVIDASAELALVRSPILLLAVAGLMRFPPPLATVQRSGIVVLLYGAFHFVVQGKGWTYQAFPLLYGLSLMAGLGAVRMLESRWLALRFVPVVMLVVVASASVATMTLQVRTPNPSQAPAMMRDLEARLHAGDRVQPFDTYGSIDAMRRLGVLPATRFFYDFMFFGRPTAPAAIAQERQLRAEFLAALADAAPRAIIMTNQQWPDLRLGYDRLATWPELQSFLAARYTLDVERETLRGWSYRIYLRRDA